MGYRVKPDDDIRRFSAVWLGPPGYSLPFHARYAAYGLGVAIFMVIVVVELIARVPFSATSVVWTVCLTALLTTAVMSAVDADKPLRSAVQNAVNVARASRQHRDTATLYRPTLPPTIKTTRTPHDLPPID